MPFLIWKPEYSVNIERIDAQHKHLVSLLKRLHEAIAEDSKYRVKHDAVGDILGELIDYTKYHFSTEESLLRAYQYPHYENHRKQHNDLKEQVYQLQEDFILGSATVSYEMLTFLNEWVENHILGSDKQFSDFLNAKGVF